MAKKRNYDTYEGSNIYKECPWCGSGDLCSTEKCFSYSSKEINQILEKEQREKIIQEKKERNKKGRCAFCSYLFKTNGEHYYHGENSELFYCSNCDLEIKKLQQRIEELIQKCNSFKADPEINTWESETDQGEVVPESWSTDVMTINQKKDQVQKKEREVQSWVKNCQDIIRGCQRWEFNNWIASNGKRFEKYLKETVDWLAKLYVNCLTKNWQVERKKKEGRQGKGQQNKAFQELKEEINNDKSFGFGLDSLIDLAFSSQKITENQAKELQGLLEKKVKEQEGEEKERPSEKNQEYDNWHESMAKIEAGEEVDLNQWNLPPRQRHYLENMIKNRSGNTNQPDSNLIQQLRIQISQLEKKTNKTARQEQELEKKKRKLQELNKSLPLDIQISNLQTEIRELESKSNRSQEEESLLVAKRRELERLLAEKDKQNTSGNKPNGKMVLYVGGAIVGILVLLSIVVLARNRRRKKFKK